MNRLQRGISFLLIYTASMGIMLADRDIPRRPEIPEIPKPAPVININNLNALLIAAVEANNLDVTLTLLNLGANPNISNQEGLTLLVLAVFDGNRTMAHLLLNNGANMHALTTVGQQGNELVQLPPVLMAATRGHQELTQDLLARGANALIQGLTPLLRAVRYNFTEAAQNLLQTESYLYWESELDQALEMAILNGNAVLVGALIEAGADIHYLSLMQVENESIQIPAIVLAANEGNAEVIDSLLEHGAWEAIGGLTPLECAVEYRFLNAARELITRGYNVNEPGGLLHRAARNQDLGMANLLLQAGGNPRAENEDRQTSAMLARAQGNHNLADHIAAHIQIDPRLDPKQGLRIEESNFFDLRQCLMHLLLTAFVMETKQFTKN